MSKNNETFYINTDGGSRGNPGIAGAGAVVFDANNQPLKTTFKGLGTMTNNEAEYQGAILGLKFFKSSLGKEKAKTARVILRLDSEFVVKQLNGQYQIREEKLFPLFITVWNMRVADFPNLEVVHIRREENSLADELANKAMDESSQGTLM